METTTPAAQIKGSGKRKTTQGPTRTKRMGKQCYANTTPIEDHLEALGLLFTHSAARNEPEKRLVPFPTLAKAPDGISPKDNLWLPFIEHRKHSVSTTKTLHYPRYYLVAPEAADFLRVNGFVELDTERSISGFVYRISLLGIAVYAGYRKQRLESLA